jgi:hypothetical protein
MIVLPPAHTDPSTDARDDTRYDLDWRGHALLFSERIRLFWIPPNLNPRTATTSFFSEPSN